MYLVNYRETYREKVDRQCGTAGRRKWMAGRETDNQQDTQKSQIKADRQAAGRQQQVNRQRSGKTACMQAGARQAGSCQACCRQAEGKQTFSMTRSRIASMKQ
jgi:hypothetical protein